MVTQPQRQRARNSTGEAKAYNKMTATGERLEKQLAITNQHLGSIAGAIESGGRFVKRWSVPVIAVFYLFFPTLAKVISEAAEKAGVVQ